MEYNYIAMINTASGAKQEVSVNAKNEQEAIEKIQSLPEFVSFNSLLVRDTD